MSTFEELILTVIFCFVIVTFLLLANFTAEHKKAGKYATFISINDWMPGTNHQSDEARF